MNSLRVLRVFVFNAAPPPLRLALISLLLLTASLSHASSLLPPAPVTHHYGIYMLGSRVGSSTVMEKTESFGGKPALRVDATTDMKVVVLAAVEQKIVLRELIDAGGRPLSLSMTMSSGGHTTKVDARFSEKQIDCTVDSGGTKSDKTIPVPDGVSLVADPDQIGPKGTGTKLKPGVKLRLYTFEPMTLQIMPIDMEVLPSETLTLGGKSYQATVIKSVTPLSGESKEWLDADGELLQDDSVLGVKMVREDGGAAPPPVTAYVPPPDFALATSIRTQTVIPNPREVHFLRLRVDGIPEQRLIISDARQSAQVQNDGGKFTVTYTIRAASPGAQAARRSDVQELTKTEHEPDVIHEGTRTDTKRSEQKALLAPTSVSHSSSFVSLRGSERPNARTPEHLNTYLSAAPYLEVEDPRIQKQAREIVGDATDPLEKARRIRAWVHEHMKPEMDIGIVRSATDVLAHPVGVCRDYAVLFTALARAAGVPARVCGGIVYFRGRFYYHAWSEVGVPEVIHEGTRRDTNGELTKALPLPVRSSSCPFVSLRGSTSPNARTPERLTWIAFDATLPTDFVDATHLKFAQGDPTAMFQAVRVVGQIKAQVLEYH